MAVLDEVAGAHLHQAHGREGEILALGHSHAHPAIAQAIIEGMEVMVEVAGAVHAAANLVEVDALDAAVMPAADLTGRDRAQVEQAAGVPEQDTLDTFDGRGSACGIETIECFLVQYVVTIRLER